MRVVSFLGCVCSMLLVAISLGSSASIYPGTVTEVQCGGSYVNPGGISSDSGAEEIVGQWSIQATSHAFVAPVPANPTTTPITQCSIIDPPNATFARATGIMSVGHVITGFYEVGSGNAKQFYAFILDQTSGKHSSFNINSTRTVPMGINIPGVLVGSLGNQTHGFAAYTSPSGGVYSVISSVSFDFPGATNTEVNGINNSYQGPAGNPFTGQTFIVGDFNVGSHGFWGTVTVSGTGVMVSNLTQFDCSGAAGTKPYGINDAGMMVGVTKIGRTSMGFITTFDPTQNTFSPNCATYLVPSNAKSTVFEGVNNNSGGAQIFGGFPGSFVLTPISP